MLPELGSLLGMSHAHPRSALPTPLGVGITAHFTHRETEAERNEPRASQGLWGWTQDCRGRSLSRVPLLVPLPNTSSAPALRQALHGQSSKHSSTPAPVSRGCCNKQPHPWWLDRNPSHSSAVPELEIEVSGRLCSLVGGWGGLQDGIHSSFLPVSGGRGCSLVCDRIALATAFLAMLSFPRIVCV